MKSLKEENQVGLFKKEPKYVFVKLNIILRTLNLFTSRDKRMDYLKENYPNLAIILLKKFRKETELSAFLEECNQSKYDGCS